MFSDPVGYLLTWTTYGTWLPGDARGWVEYRHGWQPPNPIRELESLALMSEDACRLSIEQREAVERQMADSCVRRGWLLHAATCRSNHVHVVVWGSEVSP